MLLAANSGSDPPSSPSTQHVNAAPDSPTAMSKEEAAFARFYEEEEALRPAVDVRVHGGAPVVGP